MDPNNLKVYCSTELLLASNSNCSLKFIENDFKEHLKMSILHEDQIGVLAMLNIPSVYKSIKTCSPAILTYISSSDVSQYLA
jgi:hypothetical protein